MIQSARRLWTDERGNTTVMAVLLLTVMIGIGAIVGLATIRDHVVTELGDIGVALDSLDQSFSYEITIDKDGDGNTDQTISANYEDPTVDALADPPNAAPAGLTFVPGSDEDTPATPTGDFP